MSLFAVVGVTDGFEWPMGQMVPVAVDEPMGEGWADLWERVWAEIRDTALLPLLDLMDHDSGDWLPGEIARMAQMTTACVNSALSYGFGCMGEPGDAHGTCDWSLVVVRMPHSGGIARRLASLAN